MKSSQTVIRPMQKKQHEKSCKIQGGSPEVAVVSDYGKKFHFRWILVPIPSLRRQHKFAWNVVIKFLSLSDHHSHFWAVTFDFTTFSCCLFLHGPHLFLQFGCFCTDIYIYYLWVYQLHVVKTLLTKRLLVLFRLTLTTILGHP